MAKTSDSAPTVLYTKIYNKMHLSTVNSIHKTIRLFSYCDSFSCSVTIKIHCKTISTTLVGQWKIEKIFGGIKFQ